jgi:EpsI family protein
MATRRDLLVAGGCFAAAAGSYGLKPRRSVSLQGASRLDQYIPRAFGEWTSRDVSDLVAPPTPDSLAAKLYGETVGRVYTRASTASEIMMLLAHGNTQSNDLQLHRPEVCYPAFGFSISNSVPIQMPLPGGITLPARRLVATSPDRQENIIYWARLGEFMPIDGTQQRLARVKTALHGYVADGLLARFSMAGSDPAGSFATLIPFIGQLIRAVAPSQRLSLIGTMRANEMVAAHA